MNTLKIKLLVVAGIAVVVLSVVLVAVSQNARSNKINRNISIAGISVAGFTKEQAYDKIAGYAGGQLRRTVFLKAAGRRWVGSMSDLGVRADITGAVEEAYNAGRNGGMFARAWASIVAPQKNITLKYLVDRKKFDATLDKIARAVEVPHEDARISRTEDGFDIEGDRVGIKVDRKTSVSMFRAAVESGDLSLNIKLVPDHPDVTAQMLSQIDTVLGSYTTRFPAWRIDRTHNIRMAARKVDGAVVKPGEVFSYNDTVGPRLKSTGYRDAPIFIKGKLVPGTGGGICQVSSTVYNAALLANMKIVQRSNHSSAVPYVGLGRDATVAYGLLDLKFRNITSSPIYISSKMKGSYLYVDIFGSSRDKTDVAVVVEQPGKLRATVYRVVKQDGKVVARELISRDRYRPAEPMEITPKPKAKPKNGQPLVRVNQPKQSAAVRVVRSSDSVTQ